MDKPNGECIFLEGDHCAVEPVNRSNAGDFPNLWTFPASESLLGHPR